MAKDDGKGIVRNLRLKLLKIAGDGQFGVRGMPALKRAFVIFDEVGTGCVPTETFYRVVTRLGVRIGSKGRKKLTHLLGVEGGEKVIARKSRSDDRWYFCCIVSAVNFDTVLMPSMHHLCDSLRSSQVSYAKLLDFSTSSEEAEQELEFKIVAAVISAMRSSKCEFEALRGAVMAWDESACGSVTLEDFSKGLQQSGVGNELSKGLIEAIGRRYAGERNMVVYGGLLAKVKEAVDELEEKERRSR